MPKISFVMPTRNRLEWIGESLQSLLTQTERDIEIIVVNDASDDGTTEWLKEYESDLLAPLFPYDKRVKIIHNEKQMGGGLSRNIGTDAATASLIAVCDDDDLNANERASLILKHFELNPKSELVNFPYLCVGYYNEKLEEFDGEGFDHDRYLKDGSTNFFSNPTVAVKKESLQAVGGYGKETFEGETKMTDDAIFLDKWIKSGRKVDFQPGFFVVFHRNLPHSMMTNVRGWHPDWVEKK